MEPIARISKRFAEYEGVCPGLVAAVHSCIAVMDASMIASGMGLPFPFGGFLPRYDLGRPSVAFSEHHRGVITCENETFLPRSPVFS